MNTRPAMTEEVDDRNKILYHERETHQTTVALECENHCVGVEYFAVYCCCVCLCDRNGKCRRLRNILDSTPRQ